VFPQFVRDATERMVRPEIDQHPLQRQ
jgi:hypothetical protein